MFNKPKNKANAGTRIIILMVLALAGLILTSIVLILMGMMPEKINTILSALVLQDLLVFLLPPIAAAVIFFYKPLSFLALDRRPSWLALGVVVAVCVVSMPALNWITEWNESIKLPASMRSLEQMLQQSEQAAKEATQMLFSDTSWINIVTVVLVVGLLPGLVEEMFFRGGMLRLWSPTWKENHVAAWSVGIFFSAIHIQFYGFFPRMLLGVWFAYLLLWTRNLWVPIIAHALNNTVVVVFSFMSQKGLVAEDAINHVGLASPGELPWMAMVSAVATIALVLTARKKFIKIFSQNDG